MARGDEFVSRTIREVSSEVEVIGTLEWFADSATNSTRKMLI